MSRGQSQRRVDSQKRSLERCKLKGKYNNVVDIDSDRIANLIIIDAPETSEGIAPDASVSGQEKTPACRNIICIDDDESGDCGSSSDSLEESGNPNSYFTSSNKCRPSCNQGRKLSSKTSNCWATCSSKRSSSDTSCENDDSDCDIEEDHLGNIRQQWEEASLRKKRFDNFPRGQFDFQNEVGPVGFDIDSRNDIDVDKTVDVPKSCSSNGNHRNDNLSTSKYIGEDASVIANKSDGESWHTDKERSIQQEMYKESSVCCSKVVNETNGDGPSGVPNFIVGNREMLKKTDAYRRAEEEEWASRQRELQAQAEEARRLKKRKKAENLRLIETERRQKQRLEEVREAQKKDEETLNLKEQLRVEIRRELDKLEANSQDMASLLRGLGIEVRGDLPSEIRTAYKKALLRFHPDRASRSDIHQQIEAEEKFKLISRAREKFMF
ncbi:hypothetical protein JCGZ_11759 [Jatropha curcas]|uniref:J domain-containing protein n=1 Tax=Jatropha curcas TaxID=180498 RepID=A0A067K8P3_JATCU|nr:auxilin-like protein 1 [Jatropha curcas]KDP31383.1 hypothetical protein JCGZ_11759 [Jatropha curcas]